MATYTRTGTSVVGRIPANRTGRSVATAASAGSVSRINPATYTGTSVVGHIQLPARTGLSIVAAASSGTRSIGSATSYARTGTAVTAAASSGSRAVTPVGATRSRTGTSAVGRIPSDRTGTSVVTIAPSGSRILGNPGALFDRTGTSIVGRIAKTRIGTSVASVVSSGSRAVTPAGTFDRTGGQAGGAGKPNGLLLTMQAHRSVTSSGSVHVDSNVPLRTGASIVTSASSGSRLRDLSRTGLSISILAPFGARTLSGNLNRNGRSIAEVASTGSRTSNRLSDLTGTAIVTVAASGTRDVGNTPVFVRTGISIVTPVPSGRRVVRPAVAKTYIFPPITTGWVSSPEENGLVVA